MTSPNSSRQFCGFLHDPSLPEPRENAALILNISPTHFVLYKVQSHPCRALTRPAPLSPVTRPLCVRTFVADCTASKYTRPTHVCK